MRAAAIRRTLVIVGVAAGAIVFAGWLDDAVIRAATSAGVRPSGEQTQESPAIEHAKRVLDWFTQERFDSIASEFNAQMAAAMTAAQLREVWAVFGQQVGPFASYIDQRVATPAPGVTSVILGCQFAKAAMSVIVSFDADDKIAGLRFTPRPAPTQPSAAPSSSRFTEEPVTVGSGEWALPGTLSVPRGPIAAAVVLVHGSGPQDRDETIGPNAPFRDLAWGLAERDIAVLRYEKRTRQHAGKFAGVDLTVREETTEDALLAVALLRGHARIDPTRVFVIGHSLGGTLAPRIAAEDRSLAGLVIMAGATRPLLEAAREQVVYLSTLPGAAGPSLDPDEAIRTLRRAAPESYWKDLDAYKPVQTAAGLTIPMLILQGERDYQVTLADLQGWRDGLAGRGGVTIKTYPTLNHLFMPGEGKSTPVEYQSAGHVPGFVLDDIANWLKQA